MSPRLLQDAFCGLVDSRGTMHVCFQASEFYGDLEACAAGTDVLYLPVPLEPCDRGRLLNAA